MTPLADIVLTERFAAAALALWNLKWSARGAASLMRGQVRLPEIFLSFVFWMALAVLVFQASYLSGPTEWWRLFAYTVLVIAMGLAAVGHHLGAKMKAAQFYAAYDHLGVATAMVDLARVDPAAADRMADECRRLTAVRMIANG